MIPRYFQSCSFPNDPAIYVIILRTESKLRSVEYLLVVWHFEGHFVFLIFYTFDWESLYVI